MKFKIVRSRYPRDTGAKLWYVCRIDPPHRGDIGPSYYFVTWKQALDFVIHALVSENGLPI